MIRTLYRKPHGEDRRSLRDICDILNGITPAPGESHPRRYATRTGTAWTKQVLHQIIKRGLKTKGGEA
jgi:hypothetical protein